MAASFLTSAKCSETRFQRAGRLAGGATVSQVKIERPSWPPVRISADERVLGLPYAEAFEGRSRLLPRGPYG
jgi:hypothetical protein